MGVMTLDVNMWGRNNQQVHDELLSNKDPFPTQAFRSNKKAREKEEKTLLVPATGEKCEQQPCF